MRIELNKETLSRLENQKIKLGLNNRQLAEKIGVCCLTIHNWKTGVTTRLSTGNSRKLKAFLEEDVRGCHNTNALLLKKAENISNLCKDYPEIRNSLLSGMSQLVCETLSKYSSSLSQN